VICGSFVPGYGLSVVFSPDRLFDHIFVVDIITFTWSKIWWRGLGIAIDEMAENRPNKLADNQKGDRALAKLFRNATLTSIIRPNHHRIQYYHPNVYPARCQGVQTGRPRLVHTGLQSQISY